jgi:hypothetical protein
MSACSLQAVSAAKRNSSFRRSKHTGPRMILPLVTSAHGDFCPALFLLCSSMVALVVAFATDPDQLPYKDGGVGPNGY